MSTTSTCSAAPGRSTSRPRRDDRSAIDDIYRIYVRNADGEMVPLRALAEARIVLGPQALIRYNNYRSVTINGSAGAGRQLRRGARGDGASVGRTTLPRGYGYEWTGTALQEKEAAGQTAIILGLAVLFAYLFLVGAV